MNKLIFLKCQFQYVIPTVQNFQWLSTGKKKEQSPYLTQENQPTISTKPAHCSTMLTYYEFFWGTSQRAMLTLISTPCLRGSQPGGHPSFLSTYLFIYICIE